jgi:hypothetical protein
VKSRRSIVALAAIACCLALVSCDDETTGPDPSGTTAVGNAPNAFGFSVVARDLAFDRSYDLNFDSDALDVGVAVVGYDGGAASFQLIGEDGLPFYSRDLAGNIAEGTAQLTGHRPMRAVIAFVGFSGIVSLSVAGRP